MLFVIFLAVINLGESAKILGIFPVPAPSHYILVSSLMQELVKRGHQVTVISVFGEKTQQQNYTDIILPELLQEFKGSEHKYNLFLQEGSSVIYHMFLMNYLGNTMMEKTLRHKKVQNLIGSNQKFDLVITEKFVNDACLGFAYHFKAPLVLLSTVGANFWVNIHTANPTNPSYIPELLLNYASKMDFMERFKNTLVYLCNSLNHYYFTRTQNGIMQKYLGGNLPHIDVLQYEVALILLNSHPVINEAVPLVPNMIEIGGFHIKPPKSLPGNLQTFLDNAKEGAVYFSLGSNLKTSFLPTEKRQIFLNVFKKLKQKVLWKWDDNSKIDRPSNVKLGNWLPQQDILAHPNVKLFITHGGLLSTTEAIYNGVPLLTIPIFGDQKMNAAKVVSQNYGLCVPYSELSEEKLFNSIQTILRDESFRENAVKKSEIFHDYLVHPMDRAMYWIEYVIRHKGAPHLRTAATNLSWYQYFLIDVLAYIVSIILFTSFILFVLIKYLYRKLCIKNFNKKND